MAMARGSLGPCSYQAAAGSSAEEGAGGVTFGREHATQSSKRQSGLGAMPRMRFPPFEQCVRGKTEGGNGPHTSLDIKACIVCGTTETPLWRANDIDGEKNLCNACGVRQNRLKRARRAGDVTSRSVCSLGQAHRRREGSSASPETTKRAASASLNRVPSMMGDAPPMSRAWSLGQLGNSVIGDWSPYFDPHTCHSDLNNDYSKRSTSIAPVEDTAVRGEGLQRGSSRQVDPHLDIDLDPLDPRFLARIHDPHQ